MAKLKPDCSSPERMEIKSPNEIKQLKKKPKKTAREKEEILELEKMIPLKKRSLREPIEPAVPTKKVKEEEVSNPPSVGWDTLPDIRLTPQQGPSNAPAANASEAPDPYADYPARAANFWIFISAEDQRRAQDVWCEAMWNKLRPGEPFQLLKKVILDRAPPNAEMRQRRDFDGSDSSSDSSSSSSSSSSEDSDSSCSMRSSTYNSSSSEDSDSSSEDSDSSSESSSSAEEEFEEVELDVSRLPPDFPREENMVFRRLKKI